MKETCYPFDEQKFRQYTKEYYTQKPEWKKKKVIVMIFYILAVVITVAPAMYYGTTDMVGLLIIFAASAIFGLIALSIGAIIRNCAKHKLGKPYEGMSKMFLLSNYSGIQFGYHDRYDQKSATSAIVHQIAYANIHSVDVSEKKHMVTVYGSIERVEYDDLRSNRIAFSLTNGQLGDRGSFSFLLCFDNQEAFFANLREHHVKVNFV